ncbi:MAG: hypothetical protein DRJ68_01305 [Thermoprotei archaeon]|nr:MAG: hypothetical protein DRJ68_01305 [Thermoprotei archaeon]
MAESLGVPLEAKLLGGLGCILLAIAPILLDLAGLVLAIVGLILVLIACQRISEALGEAKIFRDVLVASLLAIVSIGVLLALSVGLAFAAVLSIPFTHGFTHFVGITPTAPSSSITHTPLLVVLIVLVASLVLTLISALYFKSGFTRISSKTGLRLFRDAGLLILISAAMVVAGAALIVLWGAGLIIMFIALVISLVAWILAAVAFFTVSTASRRLPPPPPL